MVQLYGYLVSTLMTIQDYADLSISNYVDKLKSLMQRLKAFSQELQLTGIHM